MRFPTPPAPAPRERDTQGRCLVVRVADNVRYICAGRGWVDCGARERAVWNERMKDTVDTWVARFAAHTAGAGCLALSDRAAHGAFPQM